MLGGEVLSPHKRGLWQFKRHIGRIQPGPSNHGLSGSWPALSPAGSGHGKTYTIILFTKTQLALQVS